MLLHKRQFREDIQGLRAIAVLAVLLFHIDSKLLPGGFIGVDVFFVISGFLITSIIARQKDNGTFSFISFYKSRIKRIVPAYYLVLFLIAITGTFLYIKSDISRFITYLKSAALFTSNLHFSSSDADYFGAAMNENPLLHTWTLAVEMQFYFFLPFVIYFFSRRNIIIIFSLLLIVLLGYSQYNILIENKSAMYFSLLSRVPEFLVGGLIALIRIKVAKPNISAALGLMLISGSIFIINESMPFPGLFSLVPCIGAVLLLISQGGSINKGILSSKPAVYIGELSYSIYLWHWPVLAFLRYYTMQYNLKLLTVLTALLFIWALSELSYRYVEGYFRATSGKVTWLKLGAGMLFTVLIFYMVMPVNDRIYNYTDYYTTPTSLGKDSHASAYKKDTIRGANIATDTLLLLGDSYGLVMGAYLDELGKRNRFAFRSVTNDSYPTIPGLSADIPSNRRVSYENLVSRADPFFSTRIIVFCKRWDFEIPSFEKAFIAFVNRLSKDQHLIIFSDFPSLDKNPIRILKGVVKKEQKVVFKKSTASIPAFIYQLAANNPNIHILDLSDSSVFNDAPFYNDTVMYYDAYHLNRYGAAKYALNTEQKFMSLFNAINQH